MQKSFIPPSIESLSDIDVADASYGKDSVVIQGVISPNSQGGWPGQNPDYKVHCFTFAAWRKLNEPTKKSKLTILRPVAPDADYLSDFPEHSIQCVRILLSSDESRAIFEESIPLDSPDQELETIAAELQKPLFFPTERFGDLVLNRSIDWFEAETNWNDEDVQITFPVDDDTPNSIAIKTAETLWSDQTSWNKRIEQYAVEELLELKNDTWLGDDETEFTAEQFISTMTLTTVSFDEDGEFEFWFDDGDLFWGHAIMVSGNLNEGPTDAGIHG